MLETSKSSRCVTAGPYCGLDGRCQRASESPRSDEKEVGEASPPRFGGIFPDRIQRLSGFPDPFDHEPSLFQRLGIRLKGERPSSESDAQAVSFE
jgi:hypothetical protein